MDSIYLVQDIDKDPIITRDRNKNNISHLERTVHCNTDTVCPRKEK